MMFFVTKKKLAAIEAAAEQRALDSVRIKFYVSCALVIDLPVSVILNMFLVNGGHMTQICQDLQWIVSREKA